MLVEIGLVTKTLATKKTASVQMNAIDRESQGMRMKAVAIAGKVTSVI